MEIGKLWVIEVEEKGLWSRVRGLIYSNMVASYSKEKGILENRVNGTMGMGGYM